MKISQSIRAESSGWQGARSAGDAGADLVLVFGGRDALAKNRVLSDLRASHPDALIVGCTTAGEIAGPRVLDDTVVSTAIRFSASEARGTIETLRDPDDSEGIGLRIGARLLGDDLRHVVVLSDGLNVNGSQLVRGLTAALPASVRVTGGLSGDGERFGTTRVLWNDTLHDRSVVAVGFYGRALDVGFSAMGGWDPFGPLRRVTRAEGNVVFEFDGKPALDLYRTYLGDYADGLPATGLLFPLSVVMDDGEPAVVRTLLGIDEEAGALTFAGDVTQGSSARLMCSNFDRLISGAHDAAQATTPVHADGSAQLALLISCVGRKMVLGQRIEEEIDAVREVLGNDTPLTGFYSYGEISPVHGGSRCELNNQTMCVTTLRERAA